MKSLLILSALLMSASAFASTTVTKTTCLNGQCKTSEYSSSTIKVSEKNHSSILLGDASDFIYGGEEATSALIEAAAKEEIPVADYAQALLLANELAEIED